MPDDFSEKVSKLLSDPEMAAKIAAVASSIGGTGKTASPETASDAEAAPSLPASSSALPSFQPSAAAPVFAPRSRNTELLMAIKPFLRAEKQKKIDTLVRAMSIAGLFSGKGKGGG